MTVTLEEIKEQQAKFNDLIAAFEKQITATKYHVAATTIALSTGERYAGLILGETPADDYHLILLPGDAEKVNWSDAGKWAAEQGGELPTRREQSLLFANLKGEFQSAWYWSCQQHEEESGWAWCQGFTSGFQSYDAKLSHCRARAVRRLSIL
jgi:hypothetical protein